MFRIDLKTSFDIRHMPQGCGTWPAAWEVNEEIWPNGGEVDIVRFHIQPVIHLLMKSCLRSYAI